MDKKSCPICNGPGKPFSLLHDDRYGFPGEFGLWQCQDCSHLFLDLNLSHDQFLKLYTDYYPRSQINVDEIRPPIIGSSFVSWLIGIKRHAYAWVPPDVRVLDIGCGSGEALLYHRQRGCEVFGVEADENVQKVAQKFNLNIHNGIFRPEIYVDSFFDYVTLDQVLEHVFTPASFLKDIARVLKAEGRIIVSMPNATGLGARLFGKRWIHWHAPYHLHFFSEKSLQEVARSAGLAVERVESITDSEWMSYQWKHLLLYPHKGSPSVFWDPRTQAGTKAKIILKLLNRIHQTRINHLLTRLLDCFGMGDNVVVFLRKAK